MRRVLSSLVIGGVVVGAVVGCDAESGTPVATSSAPAPLWDPCSEIPDDAIRAVGVDPATEELGIGGVHQSGWEICRWRGGDKYSVAVFSTARTVSEFEQKPGQVDFRDVTIADRTGRQFKVEGASMDLRCDVLFPAQQGVVQISIMNRASLEPEELEDPCVYAQRVGEVFVPLFPS
ncbi:DUF3558 domain-containing protein [Nocardia sp. NPDC058176]|uniref:DUF3558 domain-containing protein n=1 Tax=Nocardia sp. NPDC058176 TaxID=3346368 RepID=UPI0036DB9131